MAGENRTEHCLLPALVKQLASSNPRSFNCLSFAEQQEPSCLYANRTQHGNAAISFARWPLAWQAQSNQAIIQWSLEWLPWRTCSSPSPPARTTTSPSVESKARKLDTNSGRGHQELWSPCGARSQSLLPLAPWAWQFQLSVFLKCIGAIEGDACHCAHLQHTSPAWCWWSCPCSSL